MVIRPAAVVLGQSPSIEIRGLRPRERVTVTATTDRFAGVEQASATFVADRSGAVSLNSAAPVDGSYAGAASLGLLGVEQRVRQRSHGSPPGEIETTLQARAGRAAATGHLTQRLPAAGVVQRTETLSADGFVGRYFVPAHARDRAAVIVWGGSEGGIAGPVLQAATLASSGIPALALAYFDEPGLPCSLSRIPIGYFARAARWLAHQPAVNPARVWALSGSRGSEAELLLAAHWPGLLHGIVAEAPSSIGYGSFPGNCRVSSPTAWTVRGHAVPHAVVGQDTLEPDGAYDSRPAFVASLGLPATDSAVIPIGRFRGPVLLVAGGRDEVWPSATYAHQINHELRHDPSDHGVVIYPSAGHLVFGVPSIPSPTTSENGSLAFNFGGSEKTDDAAHRADWPLAIEFIHTN